MLLSWRILFKIEITTPSSMISSHPIPCPLLLSLSLLSFLAVSLICSLLTHLPNTTSFFPFSVAEDDCHDNSMRGEDTAWSTHHLLRTSEGVPNIEKTETTKKKRDCEEVGREIRGSGSDKRGGEGERKRRINGGWRRFGPGLPSSLH